MIGTRVATNFLILKKIVHEREKYRFNKSEKHIIPQDKVNRVVSINLNEVTKGHQR